MKEKIIQTAKQQPFKAAASFFHAGLGCNPHDEEADECRPSNGFQKDFVFSREPECKGQDNRQEDDCDKPPRQTQAQKSEIRVPKKPGEETSDENSRQNDPKNCQSHNNPPFVQNYLFGMVDMFLYYNYTIF